MTTASRCTAALLLLAATLSTPLLARAACGDGVLEAPAEECDDGNLVDGDCCSSACLIANQGFGCDDGDVCTNGDTCWDGVCEGGFSACLDEDECTADVCVDVNGTPVCSNPPIPCCGAIPCCGDGVVDAGESCDPPNPAIDPVTGDATCRADCTRCGDGVVQAPETCDDGNLVSGCNPANPRLPLDGCQNNCTPPICADPASIVLRPDLDRFTFHGRLVLDRPDRRVDAGSDRVAIALTADGGGEVFRAEVPAGAVTAIHATAFSYRQRAARVSGGIESLRIKYKGGAYGVWARAHGDLSAAQAHMTTHVWVGPLEWTIAGVWERTTRGWRLDEEGTVLR